MKEHSLCPEEKGRERRRSSPGLSLIVGGFSRLGGIAHSYLINPSALAIVVVVAVVVVVVVVVVAVVIVAVDVAFFCMVSSLAAATAGIVTFAPFAVFRR